MASKNATKEMEDHLKSMVERLTRQPDKGLDHKALDDSQKRWLVVGVCLHSIIAPQLRVYLEPEIKQLYTDLVTSHNIDTQIYPQILEKYPTPNGYRLNYQSINNNSVHGRNIRNFDYTVKNELDLSKLFLLPHMAHYTGFDESCDSSAILGLIFNIHGFQPAIRNLIDKIRTEVRNDWAHCDFRQWDANKFARAFQLMEQVIRHLQLQPPEKEQEVLNMLIKWQTTGHQMLDGGKFMIGILNELQHEMSFLAKYVLSLESTVMDTVPPNIREQHCRIIETWKKQDELFIETEAYRFTYKECCAQNCITITGNSGSGKSAMAYHIALKLISEGYNILPVSTLEEVQRFWDSKNRQLFVYDDPVGTESLDVVKMSDFLTRNTFLDPMFQDSINKIIFTSRTLVVRDSSLKDAKNMLVQHIIDLHSDELALTKDEKIQILDQYTQHVEPNFKDVDKITDSKCFNFPFLCSIYSKNEMYQRKGDTFFEHMFPVLLDELDSLKNNFPVNYLFLVLCLVLANESKEIEFDSEHSSYPMYIAKDLANVLGLPSNVSREKLQGAEETLINVYLIKEGTCLKFLHDTLFEAVTYHFGHDFPREILKHCSSSFIRENVSVGNISQDSHAIALKSEDYPALASRYIADIRKGRFRDTFLSASLHEDLVLCCLEKELEKIPSMSLRFMFFENTSSSKNSSNANKGSWNRIETFYILLEDESVKAIHWVLARNLSRLFHFLLTRVPYFNKPKTFFSKFMSAKPRYPVTLHLIPIACLGGNVEIVKWLINDGRFGKITDVWSRRNLSALHMAVLSGNSEMVEMLLRSNINVNVKDEREITPLFQAAAAGLDTICYILIRNGAKVNDESEKGETPLFIAAQEGHTSTVRLLVQNYSVVTICRDDGASPLFIAVYNGHKEVVKILLENGSNTNKLTADGSSCLYMAAKYGYIDILRLLLQSDAHLTTCRNGETPLLAAARGGYVEVVEVLLQHQSDINAPSKKGESPIYAAVQNGHEEIFNLLLHQGADINIINHSGKSLLYVAAEKGLTEIVNILLENNLNVNETTTDGLSALMAASYKGHLNIVELLLDNKAEVNACSDIGQSPLCAAVKMGHLNVVRTLVKNKAQVNPPDSGFETPLYVAAQSGNAKILKFLLEEMAEVNKCKNGCWSPLHVAVYEGHETLVRILLEYGANVNLCSDTGSTALSIAAFIGYSDIVKLLIQNNADVNLANEDGHSPLFLASRQGKLESVRCLIQSKADVNLCSKTEDSPLICAAFNGHGKIVQELIRSNADINKCDNLGLAPIHAAVINVHNSVVYTLLQKGANINLCSDKGQTPLMIAAYRGHTSTAQLLLKHGADMDMRTSDGYNALTLAALFGHYQIVALINQKKLPLYKS